MRIQTNQLAGWPVVVCGDVLLALCLFLFVRRCMGFLVQPLNAGMLLTVAGGVVAVPGVLRLGWRKWCPDDVSWARLLARLLAPTCGVLLLACAVSLPGSPLWAVALLWFSVLLGEGTWWVLGWRKSSADRSSADPRTERSQHDDTEPADRGPFSADGSLPSGVSQQLTRSSNDIGELVYGKLRCSFDPGERSKNLHLAFCPPLASIPQLNVQQLDGPAVTIKTGQLESFGARLELRLTHRADSRAYVVVGFEARADQASD